MINRLIGAAVLLLATAATANPTQGASGYFISLDGLDPEYVRILNDAGELTATHGLGWLDQTAAKSDRAQPVETTLTAPSHISTITCTPPSRHGIVANGFYLGDESVSGFTHPFLTEPMWIAAARQGRKVMSLAYAGADARTPERHADFGIAYPSSRYTTSKQQLEIPYADLNMASGWVTTGVTGATYEHQVELVLNPQTEETRLLNVLIEKNTDGNIRVFVDIDKDLTNGMLTKVEGLEIGHMYFTETDEASDLLGWRRTAFVALLPGDEATFRLHVSGSSYNNAYPEPFRQALDQVDLVWPNYGISGSTGDLYIAGQSLIDKFLVQVAEHAVPKFSPDVVLFYQPLIDSVGHKFEGVLPQPFNPAATDEITRTYVAAYKTVDANLDRLYGAVANTAVINVMGDHGMDPIKKIVNLAALLPENVRMGVKAKTSGALVQIYDAQMTDSFNAGVVIRDSLSRLTFEGDPVLGASRDRRDYVERAKDYRLEWQHREADWAFLGGHKFWFQYKPENEKLFLEPPIYGMHGQPLSVATMATGYYLSGPGIKAQSLGEISLIDAVPTFMHQLGMTPPADCLGSVLPL